MIYKIAFADIGPKFLFLSKNFLLIHDLQIYLINVLSLSYSMSISSLDLSKSSE